MAINIQDVTISAGGAVTFVGTGIYRIETNGGAAEDDLTSWSGLTEHDLVELRVQVADHAWTILHSAANHILLADGLNFRASTLGDKILMRCEDHGGTLKLVEYVRSNIPTT